MKKLISFLFFFGLLTNSCCFAQGTWQQKANFGGASRFGAIGFSISNKGYIGLGHISGNPPVYYKDVWEWDQSANIWTQKADFPDTSRGYALGFSIANKGYVATGYNWLAGMLFNDLWQYDPSLNIWNKKANFPGTARGGMTVFTIGHKAYCGTGAVGPPFFNDFWEYDAVSDTWTQIPNAPFAVRGFAVSFSISNKGYVGTGSAATWFNDFWEFDAATSSWTQKANLPAVRRDDAVGFSVGNYGYVGTGDSAGLQNKLITLDDFWQYNPLSNSWIKMANFGGGPVARATSFVIGCRGYVGTGWMGPTNFTNTTKQFWEFTPPIPSAAVAGVNTFCAGDSTSLFASGGLFYQWSSGETTNIINIKPTVTTTYSVIVFDACGADTASMTVNVIPFPVISVEYDITKCGSGSVQFTNNSSNVNTCYWDFGDGTSSSSQSPSHSYVPAGQYVATLTVSPSPFGCNTSGQITVDIPVFSELFTPTAFSPNEDGNNDTYYIFGSCIAEMHLSIYNRWGEKVFETTDPAIGWDGTYKGEKQNAGVYMYSFKATITDGEAVDKKGNITLMR